MADIVAQRLGIPRASARAVISEFLIVMREQLVQQAAIQLKSTVIISAFVKPFTLRNKSTGETRAVDRIVLSIKPSSTFRKQLNALTEREQP